MMLIPAKVKPSKLGGNGIFTTDIVAKGRVIYVDEDIFSKSFTSVEVLLPKGYRHLNFPVEFSTEKECQKACDIHNKHHGWTDDEVNEIISKSMQL